MRPKRKANTLNKWNCHQSKALAHLLQMVLLHLLGNDIIHLLLFQEDVCHLVLLLLREWQWKVWGNSCHTMTVRSVHTCQIVLPLCGKLVQCNNLIRQLWGVNIIHACHHTLDKCTIRQYKEVKVNCTDCTCKWLVFKHDSLLLFNC